MNHFAVPPKFNLKAGAVLLILSAAALVLPAATVTNLMLDIYGQPITRTVKISPITTPQTFSWNGTNATVMDLAKSVTSTNGAWSANLVGGIYYADFGTVNGTVTTPKVKFLVPPYDAGTYDFNYCANLATNLGQFVWTNNYYVQVTTNLAGYALVQVTNIAQSVGGGVSLTNVGEIDFAMTNSLAAWKEGRVFYDTNSHTLSYYMDRSNVTVNVGQEFHVRVKNQTGSTITNGSAVTLVNSSGAVPYAALAQATTNISGNGYDCIGLATEDIAHGEEEGGIVTALGIVHNVNTDGWLEGATLYLSTNAGAITTNPPPANYARVIVGTVARGNSNNGDIFVSPQQAVHAGDITSFTNIVQNVVVGMGVVTNLQPHINASSIVSAPIALFDEYGSNGNDPVLAHGNWVFDYGIISGNGSGLTNVTAPILFSTEGNDYPILFTNKNAGASLIWDDLASEFVFSDAVRSGVGFYGNGTGLTNLNAANLVGAAPNMSVGGVAMTNGNITALSSTSSQIRIESNGGGNNSALLFKNGGLNKGRIEWYGSGNTMWADLASSWFWDCTTFTVKSNLYAGGTLTATNGLVLPPKVLTYSNGTNVMVDCSTASKFTLLLTNNVFLGLTNVVAGKDISIATRQNATGTWQITWQTNTAVPYYLFSGGSIPLNSTNSNSEDEISLRPDYYGLNMKAVLTPNFK